MLDDVPNAVLVNGDLPSDTVFESFASFVVSLLIDIVFISLVNFNKSLYQKLLANIATS